MWLSQEITVEILLHLFLTKRFSLLYPKFAHWWKLKGKRWRGLHQRFQPAWLWTASSSKTSRPSASLAQRTRLEVVLYLKAVTDFSQQMLSFWWNLRNLMYIFLWIYLCWCKRVCGNIVLPVVFALELSLVVVVCTGQTLQISLLHYAIDYQW